MKWLGSVKHHFRCCRGMANQVGILSSMYLYFSRRGSRLLILNNGYTFRQEDIKLSDIFGQCLVHPEMKTSLL